MGRALGEPLRYSFEAFARFLDGSDGHSHVTRDSCKDWLTLSENLCVSSNM